MRALAFMVALLLCGNIAFAQAGEKGWSAWRGRDGTNVLQSGKLPISWSAKENIAWHTTIPGYGWSSPIIVGDRVVLTTAVVAGQKAPAMFGPGSGHFDPPDEVVRFEVHCFELATGKPMWQFTAAEKKPQFAIHPTNTYATETPVSDGQSIFVRFGEVGLICLDWDGKERWRKEIGPFRMQGGWGTSSNPLLTDEGVILQVDSESTSFVTLLAKDDGRELWRVARRERSAWSTPFLWKNSQRSEVVLIGAKSIRSYDPHTGSELWSLGATGQTDPSQRDDPAFVAGSCKASPGGDADILLVGKGNRAKAGSSQFGPFWAVKPGGSGDINLRESQTADKQKYVQWYREDAGPVIASPLLYEGLIYIAPRNGSTIHCLDVQDGHTVYSQSLGREQYFFITPWAAGGHIYACSGSGKTFVFKAGPKYELVGINDMEEHTYAAPALTDGALIYRTVTGLFCIGQPPVSSSPATQDAAQTVAKNTEPPTKPMREGRPAGGPGAGRGPGGRQSSTRTIDVALALENLTEEQREAIKKVVAKSQEREKDTERNAKIPRAEERIRDDLRRGIEAVLDNSQKKALRTKLAEGSGDPGAANGGPITTLREQLAQIGLSEKQDFDVQTLVLQLKDDIGKAVRDPNQNRGSAIRNVTEDYKQKIIALLTDDQREQLRKLGGGRGRP